MRLRYKILVLAGLCVFSLSLIAKDNKNRKTKKNKTNSAMSLSKEMFTNDQYEDLMQAVIQNGVGMAAQNLEAEGGKPDIQNNFGKVETMLRDKFTYDYFIKLNTQSMKKEFKQQEIKEILKFYKTKLGQKWLSSSQKVARDAMEMAQTDLQVMVPKMSDSLKLAEVELPKGKK